MSKVKLTKEQATAVEKYKNDLRFRHWQEKVNKMRNEIIIEKCLLELSTDDFMNAFEYGYEVEPEFNVGDWVIVDYGEYGTEIGVIKGWIDKPHSFYIDKCHFGASVKETRHVTPEEIAEEKERRWWASHGREPWELKEDDVLTRNDDGFPWLVGRKRDCLPGYYLNGESFNLQDIRDRYRVMCFVDDRKDVDNE